MKYYVISYLLGIAVSSLFLEYIDTVVYVVGACSVLVSLLSSKNSLNSIGCLLVFLFGIYLFQQQLPDELSLVAKIDEQVSLQAKVVSESIYKVHVTEFIIALENGERVLVRTNSLTNVAYGDTVTVLGTLVLPKVFETDSGRIFNYPMYLQKDNIFYVLSYAHILEVETKKISRKDALIRWLYQRKEHLIEKANSRLPQPHAGLLAGILYGKKGSMNPDTNEQFRRVGLTHIVVLSGYNVSLVIQLFLIVLGFLPLRLRSFLALLGIVMFALLVGAGPTVVRASIMASILVFSGLVHREYDVIRALVVAGIIMVSINPYILIFDISFQLSFLATFSLIFVSPLIEPYMLWVPKILEFRSSLVATISAQIFVLPLIFYQIGEFSIIALLVNTLVLFAVPLAMLFGFVTSVLAEGILMEVGSFVTFLFLEYMVQLVSYFSDVPLLTIPSFHVSLLILIYLVLFFVLYVKTDRV